MQANIVEEARDNGTSKGELQLYAVREWIRPAFSPFKELAWHKKGRLYDR